MSNFITPNELLPIMDEVIILDARGFEDYKRGHIKGSFPVDIDKDLTGPIGEHGGASSVARYGTIGENL